MDREKVWNWEIPKATVMAGVTQRVCGVVSVKDVWMYITAAETQYNFAKQKEDVPHWKAAN